MQAVEGSKSKEVSLFGKRIGVLDELDAALGIFINRVKESTVVCPFDHKSIGAQDMVLQSLSVCSLLKNNLAHTREIMAEEHEASLVAIELKDSPESTPLTLAIKAQRELDSVKGAVFASKNTPNGSSVVSCVPYDMEEQEEFKMSLDTVIAKLNQNKAPSHIAQ